ncbi:MAG: PH domain-containing protein [Oscillospiraceae bacterium]|nr:PH domain-containing protein [Oscillospiraceae bacterium]
MLDFEKGRFHRYRLSEVPYSEFESEISCLLTDKETVLFTFRAGRDGLLFTTKRLIAIDHENRGKTDFTSIPYSSIDVFSVETAGWLDRDAELDIYMKGIGKFCFEFDNSTSMAVICKHISVCRFN